MNYILQTLLQDDSTRDDEEAKSDFWTMKGEFSYRHHVEPRVKLFVPKEETFISYSRLPEQLIRRWTYCWKTD